MRVPNFLYKTEVYGQKFKFKKQSLDNDENVDVHKDIFVNLVTEELSQAAPEIKSTYSCNKVLRITARIESNYNKYENSTERY